MYVAAGALPEALASLRGAQQPDTAAMFILACQEIHSEYLSSLDDELRSSDKLVNLPGLNPESEDVHAVGEYYGQYQRKLVHLCMDSQPFSDWENFAGIPFTTCLKISSHQNKIWAENSRHLSDCHKMPRP